MKVYLRDWDKLFLKDDVLYKRARSCNGEELNQLVLPTCKKKEVLRGLHNDLGHMGRDRTTELVKRRFLWPHLAEDVKNWIRFCEPCIKRKVSIPDRAPLVNITSTQPLELVCIDYLTLEPSKGAIENVLVITDHFTRFAHAIPTRNQTANTTAKALNTFYVHYGYPKFLHSDMGRNFCSNVIKEMCALVGIKKTHTTPYHAMGNGMTERFNHTLLNLLGTLEEDKKKDWKSYVAPMVQAYNSTRHDSTGYSPFYLMFGCHPRLPIDVTLGIQPNPEQSETDYVKSLREKMQYAFEVATKNANKATTAHKNVYDRRIRGATVEVGDRVLVRNTGIRGKCKLANKWEDVAYEVVDQPDSDIPVFVVKKEGSHTATRTLHRNMLLPINFLPLPHSVDKKSTITEVKVEKTKRTTEDSEGVKKTQEEESDESEEFEDLIPFTLNPLAEEFHPQLSPGITSSTSSVVDRIEDPPQTDEEEVVDIEDLDIEQVSDVGLPEAELELDERTDGEDLQSPIDEQNDGGGSCSSSEDKTPVPVPRPRRSCKSPDRYQDTWQKAHLAFSAGSKAEELKMILTSIEQLHKSAENRSHLQAALDCVESVC